VNAFNNLKTSVKVIGGFVVVVLILAAVAAVGFVNMSSINDGMSSMYNDRLKPIEQLGAAESTLYQIRGDLFKFVLLPDQRAKIETSINDGITEVNKELDLYRATDLVQAERDGLAKFDTAWASYQTAVSNVIKDVKSGKEDAALESLDDGGSTANARKAVGDAMDKLVQINVDVAMKLHNQGNQTFTTSTTVTIVVATLAALVALTLGYVISRAIARPLGTAASFARALSGGDLLRDVTDDAKDSLRRRKDEIGELGKAFDGLIGYMQEMGEVANQVAGGNLTVTIEPKSAKDELGNAFAKMIVDLRQLIGRVTENAVQVGESSKQLSDVAEQAGAATEQITASIQQVAKGTQEQSNSVMQTSGSVDQLSKAIDQIAKGAQEQSRSVAQTSESVNRMSNAIDRVASNAQSVARSATQSAELAKSGAESVTKVVQAMASIKESVDKSAARINELGQRSEEIGSIVETIDDIADQTNLLALNAAIEAARAGEHGKGFAVVADEVRKLAERSSNATKEIAALIQTVQHDTEQAVQAMQLGLREVETGTMLSEHAGQALSAILRAAEGSAGEMQEISGAVQEMTAISAEVVKAMDNVSAIVEENTAATEEMAASSTQVTKAVESIAAISEENSAAAEEVTASTEEMAAQVEEMAASAKSLAELAGALQDAVSFFKVTESPATSQGNAHEVTFRRRKEDWMSETTKRKVSGGSAAS